MKRIFKYFTIAVALVLAILSCNKQVDYSGDISIIKGQISTINSRLDSLTNAIKITTSQLTNIETSLKIKIDNTNIRVDSISNAFTLLKSQVNSLDLNTITKSISDLILSINGLTSDIKTINTNLTTTNNELKTKTQTLLSSIDSSFKRIYTIDSILKINKINSDSLNTKLVLLNTDYNNILSKYLDLLKIVSTQPLIITGKIEKGPFSKGSIISFYELDSNLSQTGKSYSTTINDNEGNYEIKVGSKNGNMVRVQTDGFYYNEVLNNLSTSRIVMTGISKLDLTEKVNINVMTHLERRRVEYLIGNQNLSYDSAKKKAIKELLTIFNIQDATINRSEKVSLFGDSKDILLNLSLLFLGYRNDAQLSELLTDFSNDFYKDGTIETADIKKRIFNHCYYIDSVSVKNNIKSKFNINTNSFSILKSYLTTNSTFIDNLYMPLLFPQSYNGTKNLLERISTDTITQGVQYSLYSKKNEIPIFDFKVVIKGELSNANDSTNGKFVGGWGYNIGSSWTVSSYDYSNLGNQTFYNNNLDNGLYLNFNRGNYYLNYYEPSTSPTPTFIKKLVVK